MKLDFDCIRHLLLTIEDISGYETKIEFSESTIPHYPLLAEYETEKVLYHIRKCSEAGFLSFVDFYPLYADVGDIHFRGSEFLASIKDDENYSLVKKGMEKVKDFSLSTASKFIDGLSSEAVGKAIAILMSAF